MVFSTQTKRKPEEEDILEDGISMPEEASLSHGLPLKREVDLESSKEEWAKRVIEEIEKETRSR